MKVSKYQAAQFCTPHAFAKGSENHAAIKTQYLSMFPAEMSTNRFSFSF